MRYEIKAVKFSMYIITFHKYYQSQTFWTNLVSVRGGVKRNVKLCKEKGKETRHSESKLRHGSQHVERVAPDIELKLKMGHQPFSHFRIIANFVGACSS